MRRLRSLLAASLSAFVVVGLAVPGVLAGGSGAGGSAPVTRYVDDDGRGSNTGCAGQKAIASSIQAAVDASHANDRILVCPGVYVGTVTVSGLGGIRIRSVESRKAIIRPATDHSNNSPLVHIFNSAGAVFSRFKLEARTAGPCDNVGAMIAINASPNSQVNYNQIGVLGSDSLGGCGYDRGVAVVGGSHGTSVLGNMITNFQESGLDLFDSSNLSVRDNKIQYFHGQTGSTATAGIGILLNSSATGVRLVGNVVRALATAGVSSPQLQYGILDNTTPAFIRGNVVRYADQAIVLSSVDGGAVVRENTAITGIGWGVRLYFSDGNTVSSNVLRGGARSIWAESDSTGNTFSNNDADGPADPDCEDQSTGLGTSGTGNTWTGNSGTSSPLLICVPAAEG